MIAIINSQNLFNINNFLIFLIELGFSVLFLLVFSCIHYGITQSTKLGKKIEKSSKWSFWYFFIFGLLLSLFTFIVSSISTIALGNIGMPLTILGLIYAMTIFYNKSVQIGAILPTIIWVLYEYNGFTEFNLEWLIRIIIVLLMAVVAIATTYIRWKKWATFLLSCLVTTILIIIVLVSSINENTGYYCVTVFVAIASTIFYYFIINVINNMLSKMSKMARQGAYDDKYFIIPSVLNEYFNEYIKKFNVSQALVVSLKIKADDKNKVDVLENIHRSFKKEQALFFKSSNTIYGLVLSGPKYYVKGKLRNDTDALKYLEQKLLKVNTKDSSISAFVSVYGVHSCNLKQLLMNNQYLIKHGAGVQNTVQLFNTKMTEQEINDNIAYATLSQKVNLNDIDVELEVISLNKNRKRYVCPRFYWPKLLTCDSRTIMQQFDVLTANTLLRSLAIKSIELYVNSDKKHYPLLVYYPVDQINNAAWSSSNFINKIKLYGLDPKQVVLSFNVNKYKYWPKQVLSNLKDLEKHNINYFLVDVVNLQGLNNLHPQAIILDESAKHSPRNSKLIKQQNFNIL